MTLDGLELAFVVFMKIEPSGMVWLQEPLLQDKQFSGIGGSYNYILLCPKMPYQGVKR